MPKIDNHTLRSILDFRKGKSSITESRCVASLEYNPDEETLDITFQGPPSGGSGTWRYYDVPLDVYVDFQTAGFGEGQGGQGRYFNLYIREQYQSERIS